MHDCVRLFVWMFCPSSSSNSGSGGGGGGSTVPPRGTGGPGGPGMSAPLEANQTQMMQQMVQQMMGDPEAMRQIMQVSPPVRDVLSMMVR